VACLIYALTLTQPRIVGIILVEMMSEYNIDEQTGLWIASLTQIARFAAGKSL